MLVLKLSLSDFIKLDNFILAIIPWSLFVLITTGYFPELSNRILITTNGEGFVVYPNSKAISIGVKVIFEISRQ